MLCKTVSTVSLTQLIFSVIKIFQLLILNSKVFLFLIKLNITVSVTLLGTN